MTQLVYRYLFTPDCAIEDIEVALLLAFWGTESLCGETQTALDVRHYFDRHHPACVIDASTSVGHTFNGLFFGFLQRELSDEQFRVERIEQPRLMDEPVPQT